jgi:hypothetical protein
MKFLDWLNNQDRALYGIFGPPLNAQLAVDILCEYLLGEDWYCINPQSSEQCNTKVVFEILYKHSKRFRQEVSLQKLKEKNAHG